MHELITYWEFVKQAVDENPELEEKWDVLRAEYKRYRNRENKRGQRKKYTEVTVKLLPNERIEIDQRRKGPGLTRPAYIKYAALNNHTTVYDPVDLKQLNYLLVLLLKVMNEHCTEHEEVNSLIQQIKNHVSQGN